MTVAASEIGAHAHHPHRIQCANCGGMGHVYRVCNHPITSFGIICVAATGPQLRYLMVQRKDSLCYVEFVRGKYNLQNRNYIVELMSSMTRQERERLAASTFDDIWAAFWQSDNSRTFMKEYEQSKQRFEMLCKGYYLRQQPAGEGAPGALVFFDLATALASSTSRCEEPDWGFPKGRRNINESDIHCACREFQEETGIALCDVQVLGGLKPFEEVFTGSNRVRYRHVYYLARLVDGPSSGTEVEARELDPVQMREIRKVRWFTFDDAAARIRPANVERREMFKRVHHWCSANLAAPEAPQRASAS